MAINCFFFSFELRYIYSEEQLHKTFTHLTFFQKYISLYFLLEMGITDEIKDRSIVAYLKMSHVSFKFMINSCAYS